MFGATLWLTLATLAGLAAGFAREWLLVADWGAGHRSDAFLVAMFLPEALRAMLAGGVLSAACLPLWQGRAEADRPGWLAALARHWLWVGMALAAAISLLAPGLAQLVGPGLATADLALAAETLSLLSLIMPGLMLQAVFAVPAQAQGRFLLPGLGSLMFNLPAVVYLWLSGPAATPRGAAGGFVLGSVLMALPLLPSAWREGWRPCLRGPSGAAREVWRQLWPLLASGGASQGLAWLERLAASYLGEGAITLVNLARKLVNIPLIALMSLNQVLLGRMSGQSREDRRALLDSGLSLCTVLTLPAAVGLIAIAPQLVRTVLPAGLAEGPLAGLLSAFAVAIVFGSWNALLARYYYAAADTRTPLSCELRGNLAQAACLLTLPALAQLYGIALAGLVGVLTTGLLLTGLLDRAARTAYLRLAGLSLLACGAAMLAQGGLAGLSAPMAWSLALLLGGGLLGALLLQRRHG